jgi:[ribosomal protein S5]-alanine N-acetyltransferase
VAPTDFPTLQTERLRLREIRHADAPTLLAILSHAQIMRWVGVDALKDLEAAHQLVSRFLAARVAPVPSTRWALERCADGQLLGTCGVFNWDKNWHKCMLGYEMHPDAQGQGFMQEALNAVLAWAFEHMALHRVEALIHPDNQASLKLAKRLGFQTEGLLREVGFWNNTHHDLVQHGLLRREFSPSGTFPQPSEGVLA